jgi:KaiC/GvpD/RAD55 family RecA-like ATPase
MVDDYRGRTPVELLNFFRSPGGHSLLIKGDAGTGKTTLALQLIEELAEEMPDYYMSMRVSDEALYRQFPWLEEKSRRNNVLRMGRAFLTRTKKTFPKDAQTIQDESKLRVAKDLLKVLSGPEGSKTVTRTELLKLEGQIESGEIGREEVATFSAEVSEESIVFDVGAILPELELAYDLVEANLPKRTFLIVDSIDALAEHYGIERQRIMNTLQKDLVEQSGTNIAYVIETSEKNLFDYLGDGVVRLYNEQRDGRRIRELVLEKLRGLRVDRWKYPFTLLDGRLRVLESLQLRIPEDLEKHLPVKDPNEESISTGNTSMDGVLGGLPRGGVVLLEVGEDVSQEFLKAIEHVLIADQLSKRRGVVWFPLFAINYAVLEKQMRKLAGKEALSSGLRILDAEADLESRYDFVSMVEGSDATQDLRFNTLRYALSSAQEPYLSLLGFDSLQATYGMDTLTDVLVHVEAMKRNGHVVVIEATSSSGALKQLAHQAQLHLRLESLAGTVVLCGVKPYTQYYYLDFERSTGKIAPDLVAMV